jgi:pimeloyl-ACP methyl ester carboxylesterase
MATMDAVFFPGIGGNADDWAPQYPLNDDDRRLAFLETSALAGGPEAHAEHGLDLFEDDLHVVGHSYGAIAALKAAALGQARVTSLALVEPSCLGVSAHLPATAATLDKLRAVWAEHSEPPVPDGVLAARFFENVHGQIDPENPTAAQAGANLRAWGPPWSHTLDLSVAFRVPTLVVTGAWSDTYEEIARVIAEAGARHVQLTGFEHNPQNHPDFNVLLKDFWESA